jgi:ParB-like chromosome segregation protein Spo0J
MSHKKMKRQELQVQMVPVAQLRDWEKNPRINDQAAVRLSKLIESHGFLVPIIATPDGTVRAGHTRLKAAKLRGLSEVPVIFISFDNEAEAVAFSLAENRSHEWAQWDFEGLQSLLTELDEVNIDLEAASGWDENEIQQFLKKAQAELEAEKMELVIPEQFLILINCENEAAQKNLLQRFDHEGLQCRALIS